MTKHTSTTHQNTWTYFQTLKYSLEHFSLSLNDARLLLAHVINERVDSIIFYPERTLTAQQFKTYMDCVTQRHNGKPVDKIIGKKGFWKYEFSTSEDVLSPRPDSETLIEAVFEYTQADSSFTKSPRILDIGTGSGCLIISLLKEYNTSYGVALDISPKALTLAKKNALDNDCLNCDFIESNWLSALQNGTPSSETSPIDTFDIIISNPPYIPKNDILTLDKDVRCFDPMLALDGGKDGLTPYRIIANEVQPFMHDHSIIAVEFGIGQHTDVKKIFTDNGFEFISHHKDLGDIIRIAIFGIKS